MVRLDKIQEKMIELYEKDKSRVFVEASGTSLEEAIDSAAVQLGVKVNFLDYEVVQKGKSGFFAIVPRDWKIIAYKNYTAEQRASTETGASLEPDGIVETLQEENVDGQAFICRFPAGVFLKVTPPVGSGKKIKFDDVFEKFRSLNLPVPEEKVLMPVIKDAVGEYVHIAPYDHNPVNDAMITVSISDDQMSAYIYVIPPGPGGADVSAEQIEYFLKNQKVVFGYDLQKAIDFQDKPVYKEEYLVASGKKPQNGKDAYIKYNFEVDPSNVQLKEGQGGQIDFRDLNLIQNVVEGQALAEKIPAERGVAGTTVVGQYLEASNGKDIAIPLGKNTKLADDGLTVLAEINGHVKIARGKITVEPVLLVNGNVSLKTGNIEFLGSVVVTGNVDDGFSVRASGNIEIKGTVGRCNLDAEGDIIISQGVIGKDGANIRSGKSVWAKFIQSAKMVFAGENVIVSDGILNSDVMANKKIICSGRRADIIGGNLSATELIAARNIGSSTSGSDTVLSVGFDPKAKERLEFLKILIENNRRMLSEVNLNLKTLEEQKKRRGGLQADKEEALQRYQTTKYTFETEIGEAEKELEKIKEYLETIKTEGRISASGNVYIGVTLNIKNFTEVLRSDARMTTFHLNNGLIRQGKYQKPEGVGGPSGYSAN
ncbi:MAG: FapA family protein [Treponemataceae bacterium]